MPVNVLTFKEKTMKQFAKTITKIIGALVCFIDIFLLICWISAVRDGYKPEYPDASGIEWAIMWTGINLIAILLMQLTN
jgi:hypothetical protein